MAVSRLNVEHDAEMKFLAAVNAVEPVQFRVVEDFRGVQFVEIAAQRGIPGGRAHENNGCLRRIQPIAEFCQVALGGQARFERNVSPLPLGEGTYALGWQFNCHPNRDIR